MRNVPRAKVDDGRAADGPEYFADESQVLHPLVGVPYRYLRRPTSSSQPSHSVLYQSYARWKRGEWQRLGYATSARRAGREETVT